MVTELTLFGAGMLECTFLLLVGRRRQDFLVGAMAVNLILISLFGGQLISVFGFVINAGNIFYAAISLILYLLIENFGHREAERGIWVSFLLLLLFLALSQLAASVHGVSETGTLERALRTTFSVLPRIALASMLAFLLAQHVNVHLYREFPAHDPENENLATLHRGQYRGPGA